MGGGSGGRGRGRRRGSGKQRLLSEGEERSDAPPPARLDPGGDEEPRTGGGHGRRARRHKVESSAAEWDLD